MNDDRGLTRLLQLASPTLPVGAYSYSQGLEGAVEAGIVRDAAGTETWIGDVLECSVGRLEAPVLWRLIDAWRAGNWAKVEQWNTLFLVSRETAELRAETAQMGYSLARLLIDLDEMDAAVLAQLRSIEEISFPAAFACATAHWSVAPRPALIAYLWAWLENQVMAAVKSVPLGQTEAQRILLALGERAAAIAERAARLADDDLASFAPRLAILSSRHETQYSRLFRS